jgi:SH3 domain protein
MTRRRLASAVLVALLAAAAPAAAGEYIRDELRVNMRAGPGLQYKILKMLSSGEEVTRLASNEEWVQVRTSGGKVGWLPLGYLSKTPPPSVALPEVQAKLTQAQTRIEELDSKLATQTSAITELDELRRRNEELEVENQRLSFSATWKNLATGAAIIALGALIGLSIPRGGASRSRLKL